MATLSGLLAVIGGLSLPLLLYMASPVFPVTHQGCLCLAMSRPFHQLDRTSLRIQTTNFINQNEPKVVVVSLEGCLALGRLRLGRLLLGAAVVELL